MLAGGKEVNYLMINGDVFQAKNNFLKLYKFGNNKENNRYFELAFDANQNPILNEVKAEQSLYYPYYKISLVNYNSAKVAMVFLYKNEKYALAKCRFLLNVETSDMTGIAATAYLWIKMSDYGGGTPIAQNGGVNSPSYLLFIYDIGEVVPYVS